MSKGAVADPLVFVFRGTGEFHVSSTAPHLPDFKPQVVNGFVDAEGWVGQSVSGMGEAPSISPEDLFKGTGEWTGVMMRHTGPEASEYIILGDYFGHQRIFYFVARGYIVVSTSYDELLIQVSNLGDSPSVNWSYVLPTLTSQNVFCSGAWASATMHNGVRELFPGELLWLRHDQIALCSRQFRDSSSSTPSESQYHQLIDEGVSKAVAQLRAYSKISKAPIRVSLSGGRDSRVVLALALHAGLGDRLVISSANPDSYLGTSRDTVKNDLEISQAIAEYYGIANSVDDPYRIDAATFASFVEEFQAENSGGSYNIPRSSARSYPAELQVELHGGGGELLRTAFSAWPETSWWKRLIKNRSTSFKSDVRALFDVVFRAHLLTKSTRESGIRMLERTLRGGGASSLLESLNHHYQMHRNRWHFGQRIHSASRNRRIYYPLEQPEFFIAANSVPYDDRSLGLVAFDIIKRTVPTLNRFAFDNAPGWPSRVYRVRGECESVDDKIVSFPSVNRLNDARMTLKQNAESRLSGASVGEYRTSEVGVGRALLLLEIANSVYPEKFDLAYRNSLAEMLRTGRLDPLQTVSRLHSLLACYLSRAASPAIHFDFDCRSRGAYVVSSGEGSGRPGQELSDPTLQDVVLKVSASVEGSSVIAEVDLQPKVDFNQWQFAFYLISGKTRIGSQWYSDSPGVDFSGVLSSTIDVDETLSVRAFARRSTANNTLPLISNVNVVR